MPERGDRHRVRDQIDRKVRTVRNIGHAVDGETDSVDRDRPLVGQKSGQVLRRAHHQFPGFANRFELLDAPETVDMAGHQMPAQLGRKRERFFEIDVAGRGQAGRFRQAFARYLHLEAVARKAHNAHACTLHRDGVADGDIVQPERRGIDRKTHPGIGAAQRIDMGDAADRRDDSGKHGVGLPFVVSM